MITYKNAMIKLDFPGSIGNQITVCMVLMMINWLLWDEFYNIALFRFVHLILSTMLGCIIGLRVGWCMGRRAREGHQE